MAYRVVYGPMPEVPKRRGTLRVRTLTAVCLLLFCFGVRLAWPEGQALLRRIVLPGEMTVTQVAFGDMLEHLKQGYTLGDAVTVFCRQVVQDGLRETN